MAWSTNPGTGDLGMQSGDVLYTGTVTAQAVTAYSFKTGNLQFTAGSATLSTSATAGSAAAPPSQPVGYITVQVSGVARKMPFYAT